MQELFFTLLTIWVLFKIFGKSMVKHQSFSYTQNNYNKTEEKEGEVKMPYIKDKNKKQKKNSEEGEYVDYIEIK